MRVFMTGASGWIGSAVIPELLDAGHQVTGLARSDASAATIEALGAEAFRGSLDDPSGLSDIVAKCDGVIHLGYNHDFSQMQAAADTDRAVVEAIGSVLKNSDRPFIVAGGVIGIARKGHRGCWTCVFNHRCAVRRWRRSSGCWVCIGISIEASRCSISTSICASGMATRWATR